MMKHIRKRRAFALRPSPISLTSLRREVANRRMQQRSFAGTDPVAPLGVVRIIDRRALVVKCTAIRSKFSLDKLCGNHYNTSA